MLFEWGKYEDMDNMLRIGIGICEKEKHREIIPYIRKKRELYGYLLEAYQEIGDLDKCREVEKSIEEEKEGRREGGGNSCWRMNGKGVFGCGMMAASS